MNISIKDYSFQNIMFVHNFILIFLVIVFIFVSVYLILTLYWFNLTNVLKRFTSIYRYIYLDHFKRFYANRRLMEEYTFKGKQMFKLKGKLRRSLFNRVFLKHQRLVAIYAKSFEIHNIKLEIIWTVIPILFIVEMIFPSLSLIADDEMDHNESLYTIGVIGNQWYWVYELNLSLGVVKYVSNLILLEDSNLTHQNMSRLLATTQSLPIAVGMKTSLYITSNDVAHSWALPSLGVKVDAIPGRINLKTIIASRLGLYSGMCSELCGTDHGFMPISVNVLTLTDWWYNIKNSLVENKDLQIMNLFDVWLLDSNQ